MTAIETLRSAIAAIGANDSKLTYTTGGRGMSQYVKIERGKWIEYLSTTTIKSEAHFCAIYVIGAFDLERTK